MRQTVDILGVKVDTFTAPQALDYITQLVDEGGSHYIVTPNPEFVMQTLRDSDFKRVVNDADLALADGVGLMWAAKYLTLPLSQTKWLAILKAYWQWLWLGACIIFKPKILTDVIPERITGADMVWEVSKLAAKQGWSVFLLGAAPGIAMTTAQRLKFLYPQLNIAGAIAGPPYETKEEVINQLKNLQPTFVFLAFPAAEQLRWIKEYKNFLPKTIWMGVGGALDFIAGGVALNAPEGSTQPAKRAPEWLQKRGLEWVWRYLTQPWRRERIKNAVPRFMLTVVKYKLVNHFHHQTK